MGLKEITDTYQLIEKIKDMVGEGSVTSDDVLGIQNNLSLLRSFVISLSHGLMEAEAKQNAYADLANKMIERLFDRD